MTYISNCFEYLRHEFYFFQVVVIIGMAAAQWAEYEDSDSYEDFNDFEDFSDLSAEMGSTTPPPALQSNGSVIEVLAETEPQDVSTPAPSVPDISDGFIVYRPRSVSPQVTLPAIAPRDMSDLGKTIDPQEIDTPAKSTVSIEMTDETSEERDSEEEVR